MKRLGLVGVGRWGRRYIDTIARRSDSRISAIARTSTKPVEGLADARIFRDWRALLELASRGELDGVIVATTPENQFEVVAAAVERGVAVLSEKPLGFPSEPQRGVLARWQQRTSRPLVIVNFIHLWAPAFRGLCEALASEGGRDQVVRITAQGCGTGPFRGWSTLHDYAPHDGAMLLRALGGDLPMQVRTARREHSNLGPGAELLQFELTFGEVAVSLTVGNGSPNKRRLFEVVLRSGKTLVYDDLQPHPNKLVVDGRPIAISTAMALDEVIADFLRRIVSTQAGGDARGEGDLAFCYRVGRVLDQLAAACG